jgi:hypothetical protein
MYDFHEDNTNTDPDEGVSENWRWMEQLLSTANVEFGY